MMVNTTRIRSFRARAAEFLASPPGKQAAQWLGWFSGGFVLAAGALECSFQPLGMALVFAAGRRRHMLAAALGAGMGYVFFWGDAGGQGIAWALLALGAALWLGEQDICRQQVFFLPAVAALILSGSGVIFLLRWGDDTPIRIYLLRIFTGMGATLVFRLQRQQRGTWLDWVVQGIFVLALAQVVPAPWLSLGYGAAGYFCGSGAFPAAALTGLGLDLSRVTDVPMTGVLSLGWCLRLLPVKNRLLHCCCAALAFTPVAWLTGSRDLMPLPGLMLGGLLRLILPGNGSAIRPLHRRGETAVAQVRLEQMALALRQMEETLLRTPRPEPDRQAVLSRCQSAACDFCPERRQCKGRLAAEQLPVSILEQPGLGEEDLPRGCRKQSRLLAELRRGQEQLRRMKGDRNRLLTYQNAAREQYGFLADFLQGTSDDLARRTEYRPPRFRPEVFFSSRSCQEESGDKCVWFPGPGNLYYILLCDGMGTGDAAAQESRDAIELLKKMLSSGLPAEYALRSLNTLAVLGEKGGCTTVDLVQLRLDTGKGTLYKWGAAPSYQLRGGQVKKIGTAGPPPGLSQQARETVDRLSLTGGEVLILLSDGAGEDVLLRSAWTQPTLSPGEMAAAIVQTDGEGRDDATAVVIRLCSSDASTQ